MRIRNWFKRRTDKLPTEDELLHDARMESLRKKTQTADEIIEMMRDFVVERRMVDLPVERERRHA